MTPALDETNRRLLGLLQRDGRITTAELAERLNLSPTPVARRWRRLEEEGYIRSYQAVIDLKKLGYTVSAYVSIRLRSNDWQTAREFEQAVSSLPNILECCVVAGGSDYALQVIAKDLEDYERFLKRDLAVIQAVKSIDSTIILSRIFFQPSIPI